MVNAEYRYFSLFFVFDMRFNKKIIDEMVSAESW